MGAATHSQHALHTAGPGTAGSAPLPACSAHGRSGHCWVLPHSQHALHMTLRALVVLPHSQHAGQAGTLSHPLCPAHRALLVSEAEDPTGL